MLPTSCLKTIHDKLPSLSYSEKLIAKYTLENAGSVIDLSIHTLADTLGIAPSTIVCFVKKLGYSGFRQFKIGLASEINNPLRQSWFGEDGTTKDDYHTTAELNIRLLQESCASVNRETLTKAASAIISAKKVTIFGIGTSSILANEAFDLFFRLGINCAIMQDVHYQILSASFITPEDVALIISQSGINKTIMGITEKIKERKATSIGCNLRCDVATDALMNGR